MSTRLVRISASAVGTQLPPARFQASARALMCYAAALDGQDSIYLDDLHPGGLVGLPAFTVVPEWRVMNGLPYRHLLGLDDAAMWKCLHVQQDSRFMQPFRPGMVLETQGTVECLRQTRIGVYVAVRLRSHALASPAPGSSRKTPACERHLEPLPHAPQAQLDMVAESWFCGIFLDACLEGPDTVLNPAPVLAPFPAEAHSVTIPLLTVDRTLPHLYTAAADIWNPIHTEHSAARQAGLPDILLHGTCTWASAGLHLIRRYTGNDPAKLRRLSGRMASKVEVGAQLSIQYASRVTHPDGSHSLPFQVINQRGEVVLADGIAELSP